MLPNTSRRSFLKTISSVAAVTPLLPTLVTAQRRPRLKITDVRVAPLKLVKEVGWLDPAWSLGSKFAFQIGGGDHAWLWDVSEHLYLRLRHHDFPAGFSPH